MTATLTATLRRRVLRPIVGKVFPGALDGGGTTRTVPGTTIPVTEQGAGPPILLVHAGSTTGDSWAGVANALATRHRVLRYDRPTYRIGSTGMAAEIEELLTVAAQPEEPVVLVGHSSGAVVALEAALAEPARFRGVVLYEPPVAVTEPLGGDALRRAQAAIDAGRPGRAMAVFLREISGASAVSVALTRAIRPLWRLETRFAAEQLAEVAAIESLGVGVARYARVTTPTVLLGGGRSPAHLRARLDALATTLPQVDARITLPRQGHLATVRAPREVAAVIADFAARVP